MVSNASPGAADIKTNELFVHMAHASSHSAFAQDGYFKCPHPTIIDGDIWRTVVGFLVVLVLQDI